MEPINLLGIDIGGTKCAVCLGRVEGTQIRLIEKRRFPTMSTPAITLQRLILTIEEMQKNHSFAAIGICCGGPLDSERGLVLSPPNLPGWDAIDVVEPFQTRFGVPVKLQNDANAGVLAEWYWGAGRGYRNIIFLTFGTGMGAGLLLDGRLYIGTNELAGEVGHVRLAPDGPLGYGKRGSFEGFCSGGGIARLARHKAQQLLEDGRTVRYCAGKDELDGITAEVVGKAAQEGDPVALEVWETAARYLGQGLALLIDILNPQRIILGNIYLRQQELLEALTLEVLRQEALLQALAVCEIVPAGLGEQVGDYASLAVAWHHYKAVAASHERGSAPDA